MMLTLDFSVQFLKGKALSLRFPLNNNGLES